MATTHDIDNQYTQAVADFVSGMRYEDIPVKVLDRIKLLMLDSFGCALYGVQLEWVKILKKTLREIDCTKAHGTWGSTDGFSAPHAALVNGTQVQGFELDDVHGHGVMHVGAVTLPAVLAAAQMNPLQGRELLAATVAGYEVGPRVGIAMGQEHIGQGWHSGATLGVFSAAAGAARAFGLDSNRTVHALGIAGTQAAGLMAAQYGAMVKRMHAGRSAQSGLYGALLARNGFTGILDVFEAPYGGFCSTFSRSTDRFDLEALRAGFGETWETMRISLKFYSCVGSNHTTLDAIRNIKARRDFTPETMREIVVHGSQVTVDHVGWPYSPQGLTSAQLNLPFCVATLLLEGDVFVAQFKPECVNDQSRVALSRKVRVEHDPEITALGSKFRHKVRVEVHYNDGHVETETVEAPRGSEYSFASDAHICAKFMKLATETIPADRAQKIIDVVMGLEKHDGQELINLLSMQ